MNKLLKGGEVAALLNISRTQAFTLMQRGDIPTVHIGKKLIRVRMTDLEQFIEDNRTAGDHSSLHSVYTNTLVKKEGDDAKEKAG